MADISILFDWQVLLLISPTLLSITLFGLMIWSDWRLDKRKGKV